MPQDKLSCNITKIFDERLDFFGINKTFLILFWRYEANWFGLRMFRKKGYFEDKPLKNRFVKEFLNKSKLLSSHYKKT